MCRVGHTVPIVISISLSKYLKDTKGEKCGLSKLFGSEPVSLTIEQKIEWMEK